MYVPSVGSLPLGLVGGICAGIGGGLMYDAEIAVLAALVGYFVGKSAQSVLWALRPETAA
jgi:hypothetical protein